MVDSARPTDSKIEPVSIGKIIEDYPILRPPVVDGLLRQGEVANIIAPAKFGKSWLGYGLALNVATGTPWLDRFPTTPSKVLLIDNELHPDTMAFRIPRVAEAMSITESRYSERIDVLSLRGRLTDYFGLERIVDQFTSNDYGLVIVDAHYRMLPDQTSENENGAITAVYNLLDSFAARSGAAWVLIHHTSKGAQGDKAVTDVGAGAGSQSRAADSHLVLREHQEPNQAVLDAALRSWAGIEPIGLRWEFPLWLPAELDASRLVGRQTRQQQNQDERDKKGKVAIEEALRELGEASNSQLQRQTGLSRERVSRLLNQMHAAGDARPSETVKRGQQCEIWRLSKTSEEVGDE